MEWKPYGESPAERGPDPNCRYCKGTGRVTLAVSVVDCTDCWSDAAHTPKAKTTDDNLSGEFTSTSPNAPTATRTSPYHSRVTGGSQTLLRCTRCSHLALVGTREVGQFCMRPGCHGHYRVLGEEPSF